MSAPGPSDRARLSEGEMAAALAAFIAGEVGISPEGVRIEGLQRLAGGASRELWSLDVSLGAGARAPGTLALVLRRDPPGRPEAGGRGLEFRLLQVASEAGVPVPRVHWCSPDPGPLGSPFFLMDRVEGETIPRRLLRDDAYASVRETMAADLGGILARIHAMNPDDSRLSALASAGGGVASGSAEVRRIAEGVRAMAVEPHPVLDLAERWLLARAPEPAARTVVHGDFRIGNVIFDENGVRAVLDWELSHVGDPVEDLGWICVRAWRFGRDDRPVGGVGTREEFIAAYEAAGGVTVDLEALRFWEACGNYKLALVFITQARAFLDGVPSVELASLGRRTAEAEVELLRLMEESP